MHIKIHWLERMDPTQEETKLLKKKKYRMFCKVLRYTLFNLERTITQFVSKKNICCIFFYDPSPSVWLQYSQNIIP